MTLNISGLCIGASLLMFGFSASTAIAADSMAAHPSSGAMAAHGAMMAAHGTMSAQDCSAMGTKDAMAHNKMKADCDTMAPMKHDAMKHDAMSATHGTMAPAN